MHFFIKDKKIKDCLCRNRKKAFTILKMAYILFGGLILAACQSFENFEERNIPSSQSEISNSEKKTDENIFGITIDDSWYEDVSFTDIIEAIKKMPRKPTVRIVMSREKEPREYIEMFNTFHEVAYIMASPVDSYEMMHYKTISDYRKRFGESYAVLNPYVDFWEIGNEINGEGWIGEDRQLIADKMISAFELLNGLGEKTALTAYYTKPGMQEVEMRDWLLQNLTPAMKKDLDYLFISYYEDDNEGYHPSWRSIFLQLEEDFPNIKLGIGECGSTNPQASLEEKMQIARQYYSMPKLTENYVGGYFWWYWVTDCVPYENNQLYRTINEMFYD